MGWGRRRGGGNGTREDLMAVMLGPVEVLVAGCGLVGVWAEASDKPTYRY
jgi:hypothetical protein